VYLLETLAVFVSGDRGRVRLMLMFKLLFGRTGMDRGSFLSVGPVYGTSFGPPELSDDLFGM
jgi:hypothetical protein